MSTLKQECFEDRDQWTYGADAAMYFQQVVDLFKSLDTYSFLAAEGIVPSHTKEFTLKELTEAIRKHHPGTPAFDCNSEDQSLNTIYYYFNLRGSIIDEIDDKFVATVPITPGTYPEEGIKYPPKRNSVRDGHNDAHANVLLVNVHTLAASEMPPSSDSHTLNLHIVPRKFFVTQLAPSDPIPPSILERLVTGDHSCFISITRTSEEISIVLDGEIDSDWTNLKVTEWRCIKVEGPMDFGLTGIMNDLTLPLKVASISIFALSTWNTDWVLIPDDEISRAEEVLRQDGWTVIVDGNQVIHC
ncbi:hypothetical protein FRC03_000202 [Tulasnella sp. 419]|nr:hypothetical protein FRC03_000202 [Tulasnella sp. 419]